MKTSTEDQVEGKLRKAKGEIKETAGDLSNNPDLEAEGSVEKAEGKVTGKERSNQEGARKVKDMRITHLHPPPDSYMFQYPGCEFGRSHLRRCDR